MSTKVNQFIADLDGGVFEQKLSSILSDVAASVIDHDKPGEVTLNFKMKRIGSSYQVQIDHVLKYKRPTSRGSISEDNITNTPMYVGTRGALSFFPENQGQFFGKTGELARPDSVYPNKVDHETGEISQD